MVTDSNVKTWKPNLDHIIAKIDYQEKLDFTRQYDEIIDDALKR